jgi:hypothetical protein
MALTHGFSWIVGMNGEFYRALGRPSCETIVAGGTLVIYLIVYLVIVRQGLEIFVWGRMTLAMGALVFHMLLLSKMLDIELTIIAKRIAMLSLLCSLVAFTTKELVVVFFDLYWVQLVVGGLISTVVSSLVIYFIERKKILMQLFVILKNEK